MENKKFYGWQVFAACFLISVFVTGNLSNSLSLYMAPITAGLGISAATYSLTTLVGTLFMAVAAMVWAPKMQKGNMRLFMIIAVLCCAVGYIVYSFATNVVLLIVGAAITNVGMAGATQMPIALLMTMWFNKNRSTYMSLAYAGGGVGGAIFPQIISRMIASTGWGPTMRIMGIVAGVVGVLVCLFLVKKCPQEFGQTAYEGKPGEAEKPMSDAKKAKMAEKAALASWQGVTKGVALKSGAFWLLALCMFCIGLLAAGVSTHVPNYLVAIGWELTAASNVVSVFSLVAIFGTIVGGLLFDNIGPVGAVLFATASAAIALVCLIMAGVTGPLAYVFAVLFGLAQLMPKMVPAILVSNCFGVKEYASIFAVINLIFLLGCAGGSVVTGVIAGDGSGYGTAWTIYAVICAVIFVCAALAVAGGKKLRAKYPNEAAPAPEGAAQ